MKRSKILEGLVTSDKSDKTITVLVSYKLPHHLYQKMTLKKKKYSVHDKDNKAKVGDKVTIIESKPYSKNKHFRLLEVLK